MFETLSMKEVLFPKDFVFGAGGAGHQIEGNDIHCQMWPDEQKRDISARAGNACNAWEMYRTDIELMKSINLQMYRMTIEWSRIEPEQGRRDEKALARYIDMLERLNAAGIRVSVTLHHWTHPLWFEQLGGFNKRENIRYFLDHIRWLVPKIDHLVSNWNVLNEFTNEGLRPECFEHMKNMTVAHAFGYRALKECTASPASSTVALMPIHPYRKHDPYDRMAAQMLDWSTNEYFIHAINTGEMILPRMEMEYCPELAGSADYWAVNYYTRHMASGRSASFAAPRHEFDRVCMIPKQFYHEEFFPDGLVDELPRFTGKPVWIMENGVSAEDDRFRIVYLARHLAALRDAMDLGVDLRGYIHWSLMDNYEWGSFVPRFGLIHVNFDTFEREIKPSAYFYRDIIAHRGITEELRKKYIEPLGDFRTWNLPRKKGS